MSVGAALVEFVGGLVAPPICWSCSGLARRGEPLCVGCRLSLQRLADEPVLLSGVRVWAPVAYTGPARDLVRALKFRGAIGLAEAMAAQIVANAPSGLLDGPTRGLADGVALVPVPLHPRRLRSRGYNQAAAIAEAVGRRTGLEVADCLARAGPAVTQVGRDRAQRKQGPAGSIEAAGAAPERVVLVDDVVTTGSTLGASRDALAGAGATHVTAVCFARTVGR
jgi:ComF family protein